MLRTDLMRILSIAVLFSVVIAATAYLSVRSWLSTPLPITDGHLVELPAGSSSSRLARELVDQDLLEYPDLLRVWTRINGIDTRLKAGEYELQPGDSLLSLLEKIQRGDTRHYTFTLIEGWNIRQLLAALREHPQIVSTLDRVDPEMLMQTLDSDYAHPEGMFLPDTYHIDKGTRDIDLLKRAHEDLLEILEESWAQRDEGLPLKRPYDALILASIIEKETAVGEERALISGVFHNRLNIGMRLQTDPTVIYGIGEAYDGDIRFRDLRTDTPYNTYTRHGLTPTPIAMPGREAIMAAVQPAETEYLFFVAHSDRSGRHIFTSTLAEHEAQVDIHQRRR